MLLSKVTFLTPRDVNIRSEPPPKNPALFPRTMPSARVTLPPLLFVNFLFFLSRTRLAETRSKERKSKK